MASSKRSARPAKSSTTSSPAPATTSTSSRTRSTSSTTSVVIALGSNLGDRHYHLRRALHDLRAVVSLVRISSIYETDPVDAPAGSPCFLNMVVAGLTSLSAFDLLAALHEIEAQHGRVRRERNGPRPLDLDLILYGAHAIRTASLVVPHPRYRERAFVREPLAELRLRWCDPVSGERV